MLLTVTETAKNYLANMTKQHDKRYVNLAVKGGGCSGTFEQAPAANFGLFGHYSTPILCFTELEGYADRE